MFAILQAKYSTNLKTKTNKVGARAGKMVKLAYTQPTMLKRLLRKLY